MSSSTSDRLESPMPVQPAAEGAVALELFSRQLLEAMSELRSGNFDVRLPKDLIGLPGRLADVFNDIATLNQRRATEIARVSHAVGKEGRLKERIAITHGLGARSDEVQAINHLIDDLVWPTVEVTRAVGAVAKGDLTQSISLEV